jgi:hypothetical protein
MKSPAYRFDFYCGMTCYGGSDQKECSCPSPVQCEMREHPDYDVKRAAAIQRERNLMARATRGPVLS